MAEYEWLLFLSQHPASPSSLRVMVWRKMRAAGAVGLQNGVWILPFAPEHESFMQELLTYVQRQEGNGQVFVVHALSQAIQEDVVGRFCSDRNQEYGEFREQCDVFQAEIEKETGRQKFSFAELEENEQNLQKLGTWLSKIQKRDFFAAAQADLARAAMDGCRQALQEFANRVYTSAGMEALSDNNVKQGGDQTNPEIEDEQ